MQHIVRREDIFVMSMVPQWDLGYNATIANFHSTLHELGLQYLDLYMFHWPGMYSDDYTIGAHAGNVTHCGVSQSAQVDGCVCFSQTRAG